ncbi:MAG TPA: ATPase P [Syntrophobacteraceae bacterium]|nr:ATPase P [Syntrophobacteraceae bacterium]
MLEIHIPGDDRPMNLSHLVLDYNGTVACDGRLISGVRERLETLSAGLEIHILTADTFGSVHEALAGIPCRLSIIPRQEQAQAKLRYVERLGPNSCVCVGNGRNDERMLREAVLGIAVVQTEGAAVTAVLAADVVTSGILDALDLLLHPLRLMATLRS